MGYETDFFYKSEPPFRLDRPLTDEDYQYFKDFSDPEKNIEEAGLPDSWNQWIPSDNLPGFECYGAGKFYDYIEWLEAICERLATRGYKLNGTVNWRGEAWTDLGRITVRNNKVKVTRLRVVAKE